MKISCIINYGSDKSVKNLVEVCLKTVSFCDEIVVVDFSSDGIDKKLVKKYRLKVVAAKAEQDFAYFRKLGAKKAQGEWLLYLDPDERVTKKLRQEIDGVLQSVTNGYWIPRKNYYLGKEFKHAGAWPDQVLRLIKKEALLTWEGILHEQPKIKGQIGCLQNPLIHLTHLNIEQMTLKTLNWSKLEAKLRLQAGHPKMSAWRFWRVLLTAFWDSFVRKKSCLEGTEGVIEGMFQMFSLYCTYVRLWEAQQKPNLGEKYRQIDRLIIEEWNKTIEQ